MECQLKCGYRSHELHSRTQTQAAEMPNHGLIKNCKAMILIESAVHISSRVKRTHYLPNKQPQLHRAVTFLSLRAGCADPALAELMQCLFFLLLFSHWGKEGLPHACLFQTVLMSDEKTGKVFGGERESCHCAVPAYSQSLDRSQRCKEPLADGLQFVVIKR